MDDDARSLAVGSALLIHCGYVVQSAATAETALDMLAEQRCDLLVMDGRMPGMDGIEATRRIRAVATGQLNQGIPVPGFTADPSPARQREWLAAGVKTVLAKPSGIVGFFDTLARYFP